MRFSIIIPVYNVEAYFHKCLASIVNQSFGDYEVIIVDDETPDNSMAIAQKYHDAYPDKFRILHQKNTGQGGARNNGAALARGEYLIFVDSDDYIHEQMLEILDQRLRENPSDMLMFNYLSVLPTGEVISDRKEFYTNEIVDSIDGKLIHLQCAPQPWNKVYLRSFYAESGFAFPEKLLYEDVFTRILIAKANKIQICTESLYCYVQRPNSAMTSQVSPRVLEILKIVDLFVDLCIKDGVYAEYKDGIDAAMIGSIVCIMEIVYKQDANHPYKKELCQYLREKFPTYESNLILHPSVKRKINCMMNGSRAEYFIRFKFIPGIKRALIKNPIVTKLNQLRKKR